MASAQAEWLAKQLQSYNEAYRAGRPAIDDATYDTLVEKLRKLDANPPFLHGVEPEAVTASGKTVTH